MSTSKRNDTIAIMCLSNHGDIVLAAAAAQFLKRMGRKVHFYVRDLFLEFARRFSVPSECNLPSIEVYSLALGPWDWRKGIDELKRMGYTDIRNMQIHGVHDLSNVDLKWDARMWICSGLSLDDFFSVPHPICSRDKDSEDRVIQKLKMSPGDIIVNTHGISAPLVLEKKRLRVIETAREEARRRNVQLVVLDGFRAPCFLDMLGAIEICGELHSIDTGYLWLSWLVNKSTVAYTRSDKLGATPRAHWKSCVFYEHIS